MGKVEMIPKYLIQRAKLHVEKTLFPKNAVDHAAMSLATQKTLMQLRALEHIQSPSLRCFFERNLDLSRSLCPQLL